MATTLYVYADDAAATAAGKNAGEYYTSIQAAVNAAADGDRIEIAAGTYDEKISLTSTELAAAKALTISGDKAGDVYVLGGITIGDYTGELHGEKNPEKTTGALNWSAPLTVENIVFQMVDKDDRVVISYSGGGEVDFVSCEFIGPADIDGWNPVDVPRGSINNGGVAAVDFEKCKFENGTLNLYGGKDYDFTGCEFTNTRINKQNPGGELTITDTTFNNTIKADDVDDSFFCVRSDDIAVVIKDSTFNIDVDENVTADISNQENWGIFWQRRDGNTGWTVDDIEVNLTDAAEESGLLLNKNVTSSEENAADRVTINGLTSTSNNAADILAKSEGSLIAIDGSTYSVYEDGELKDSCDLSEYLVDANITPELDKYMPDFMLGVNAFTSFTDALKNLTPYTEKITIQTALTESATDDSITVALSKDLTITGGKVEWTSGSSWIWFKKADGVEDVNLKFVDFELTGSNTKVFYFSKGVTTTIDKDSRIEFYNGAIQPGAIVKIENGGVFKCLKEALQVQADGDSRASFIVEGKDTVAYTKYVNVDADAEITDATFSAYDYINVRNAGNFTADNSEIIIGADENGVWQGNPAPNGVGQLKVSSADAVFNLNNGSTLKVSGNVTNNGTINIDNSTFLANGTLVSDGVIAEAYNKGIVTNNGTIRVSGESTLNVATLSGNKIDLMDGAIIKNSTVGGGVFVAGNVTFRGDNTLGMITDFGTLTDYYGTTAPMAWTVEAGASLTLTDKARYGLGYGDKVVVNGEIAANGAAAARATLTDDDATNDVKSSLFMHGLVAQESTGWNGDSSFTVNNAFVTIGDNNSFGNKPGNYGGDYTFNFNNSVLNASRITFYEALSTTEFTFEDSDVKTDQFMTRDQDSVFTLDNTNFLSTATSNGTDEGNYNAAELNVTNGSTLTYSFKVFNEATGVINVDNATFVAPEVENSNEFNVSGESTLEITTATGNRIQIADGTTLVNSTIGGGITMMGDLTLSGDLTLTGGLWASNGGKLSGDTVNAKYAMFQIGTYTIDADLELDYGYLSYNGTFTVSSTIHTVGISGEVLYVRGDVDLIDGGVLDADNGLFMDYAGASLNVNAGTKVDAKSVKLTVADTQLNILGGEVKADGEVHNAGSITINATGSLTAATLTGAGSIVIDASEFAADSVKTIVDVNSSTFTGNITVTGNDDAKVFRGEDGDIILTTLPTKVIYFDAAFAGELGDDLGDGKYYGINAFSKFDTTGVDTDKGWSNLMVLPEDTTEIVLTAGNGDDASYGMLRPTQSITVKTVGEDYAVIDRFVNVIGNLTFDKDAKVKVLAANGLSGANNQGTENGEQSKITVNGEVYIANATSQDKDRALYLWGMTSKPGYLLINEGGKLIAEAGDVENRGTIEVKGYMELGAAGNAPKLAGVGAGNDSAAGHLIVDGAEAKLVVKHNQVNFGGGNNWQDWEDAKKECTVTIKNGAVVETAAVSFRNGQNSRLEMDGGSLIFNDGSAYDVDYSDLTSRYFDNQGEMNVSNSTIDMTGRTFTNNGTVNVSGVNTLKITVLNGNAVKFDNATLSADSTIGGNAVLKVYGESVINGTVANNIHANWTGEKVDDLYAGYTTDDVALTLNDATATGLIYVGSDTEGYGAALNVNSSTIGHIYNRTQGSVEITGADNSVKYINNMGSLNIINAENTYIEALVAEGSQIVIAESDVEFAIGTSNCIELTAGTAMTVLDSTVKFQAVSIDAASMLTLSGTTVTVDGVYDYSGDTITNYGLITLTDSTIALGALNGNGKVSMDVDSQIIWSGSLNGSVSIDFTNYVDGEVKLFDYDSVNGTYSGDIDKDFYKGIIGEQNWTNSFNVVDGDLIYNLASGTYTIDGTEDYGTIKDGTELIVVTGGTFDSKNVAHQGIKSEIQDGEFEKTVSGGKIVRNGDAGVSTSSTTEIVGNTDLTVSNGTFNLLVMGADRVQYGDVTRDGDSNLAITGGTFNSQVVGGMAYTATEDAMSGEAVLAGDINLTIEGGTFDKWIYGGSIVNGGSMANNYLLSTRTQVDGNITITVDASQKDITFGQNEGIVIVAGSYGQGVVTGDTKVVFTGSDTYLKEFDAKDTVWGGSSADVYKNENGTRTFQTAVGGDRIFTFDGFTGNFDALIRGFNTMEVLNGSDVTVTNANLDDIKVWKFDTESKFTGDLGELAGDTLEIDLDGWDGSEQKTLIRGASVDSLLNQNLDLTIDDVDATLTGNVWTAGEYKFTIDTENDKAILSKVALA